MLANFTKFRFHLFLLIIAILGLWLRFIDYDRIPGFGETQDEFAYAWAGMTLIKTGTPVAWSWMSSYTNRVSVNFFGNDYPIVSPWIDAPPLYQILSGSVALIFGQKELSQVRLSTIRLLPIILSFFSIILIGYLVKNLFNQSVSLIASILYATTPTIVLSNRLSITENLLTPLILATILIFILEKKGYWSKLKPYLIGLGCGLALLTKNTGVSLLFFVSYLFFSQKHWRSLLIVLSISLLFGSAYLLIGYKFGFNFFLNVLNDLRQWHSEGFPEAISNIFRFPTVTNKHTLFLDGLILSGFILLFSTPFWVRNENLKMDRKILIFAFPYIYLIFLSLSISGGNDGIKWYGWYLFPLFPFITILLAVQLYDVWIKPNFLVLIFFLLTIGTLSLRFLLILLPTLRDYWQYIFAFIFLLVLSDSIVRNIKFQRFLLLVIFIVIIFINILVILNHNIFYSAKLQPF